ncbi:MAG TPA: hypothetical protein VN920_15105, partial [Pyrinomonadaceae bacterium]|nr:hypothetical protein [Pyrinomonadaceae bacterium]
MAKEIWLGPLLGNKRARLIERCADLVSQNKANSFLYLAASHPLLEIVTQGILDGDRNRGLWGELPVYLFRGFVRRLLSTAVDEAGQALTPRVPIDQEELPLKRSLVSQILSRLLAGGQLKAIGPLAGREGCVNTMATLIGEIERAAKSPAELNQIIADRVQDLGASGAGRKGRHTGPPLRPASGPPASQIDFDKEIGIIYSAYCDLLNRHQLTEADADSLRALALLNGELDGRNLSVPFLGDVGLLVLDGFFDFTPVQGEILRRLIPGIPEVIVNLNHDERNREIFLPFQDTIDHLSGIAPFEKKWCGENVIATRGALARLREDLFNPSLTVAPQSEDETASPEEKTAIRQTEIRYFECGDRDTEIRAVAKEVKRLVWRESYNLADIALVVRQRASYAATIARVMREESLPCNLESRIDANDIPGLRAAVKLFDILEALSRDQNSAPKLSQLADLIKSEYFRLGEEDLSVLSLRFDAEYAALLSDKLQFVAAAGDHDQQLKSQREQLKSRYRIGVWDADALENTFAYVGNQLRVSDWLNRARQLIKELPAATATKELLNIDSADEQRRDPDEADQIENAETAKVEEKDVEKKRRPARDIHPAAIAWAALVIEEFANRIRAVPQQGRPAELRLALMNLLDQFCFRAQIIRPIRNALEDRELPQAMLNFNSLEALRRAFVTAIKSIEIAGDLSVLPAGAGWSEPPAVAGGPAASSSSR